MTMSSWAGSDCGLTAQICTLPPVQARWTHPLHKNKKKPQKQNNKPKTKQNRPSQPNKQKVTSFKQQHWICEENPKCPDLQFRLSTQARLPSTTPEMLWIENEWTKGKSDHSPSPAVIKQLARTLYFFSFKKTEAGCGYTVLTTIQLEANTQSRMLALFLWH